MPQFLPCWWLRPAFGSKPSSQGFQPAPAPGCLAEAELWGQQGEGQQELGPLGQHQRDGDMFGWGISSSGGSSAGWEEARRALRAGLGAGIDQRGCAVIAARLFAPSPAVL